MSEQLANRLRRALKKSKLSTVKLAKLTGVPQPTIWEFMNGKDIRLSTAQKIADHFGLTLRETKPRKERK